jgi:hypothetical protein
MSTRFAVDSREESAQLSIVRRRFSQGRDRNRHDSHLAKVSAAFLTRLHASRPPLGTDPLRPSSPGWV